MRILFTGSRTFTNIDLVIDVMSEYPNDTVIIHGNAKGLDSIVDYIARYRGMPIESYPVHREDWENEGKQAGTLRNSRMLYESKPDLVIAFRDKPDSRGTNDMLLRSAKNNIPRKIYDDFRRSQ